MGSVLLILLYMSAILGGRPFVRSKAGLGLTCVMTVLFALVFAFGACGICNVPFTIISPLVIFVLLGVGVDDMVRMGFWQHLARGPECSMCWQSYAVHPTPILLHVATLSGSRCPISGRSVC